VIIFTPLSLETIHWTRPEVTGAKPILSKAHSAEAFGRFIFIFGGGDNAQYSNDLNVFDTESLTWSFPKTTGFPF
jgi:hypothetical protein